MAGTGFQSGSSTQLAVTDVSTTTLEVSQTATISQQILVGTDSNAVSIQDNQIAVGGGTNITSTSVKLGDTSLTPVSVISDTAFITNVLIGSGTFSPSTPSRFNIPGTSGSSGSFTLANDPPVTINAPDLLTATAITSQQITNPDSNFFQPNADAGIQGDEPPTANVSAGSTKQVSGITLDIPTFLTQCLTEAAGGAWRSTGTGGQPSNQNIIGIWPFIGMTGNPPAGLWASDQTAWCMGFVQFVLKNCGYKYFTTAAAFGIQDPRSGASLISNSFQDVASKGQPGDILLWSRAPGRGHICFLYKFEDSISGLVPWSYVGGNQTPQGLHSPGQGDVTKSRCSVGYAQANFVGIYRPSR